MTRDKELVSTSTTDPLDDIRESIGLERSAPRPEVPEQDEGDGPLTVASSTDSPTEISDALNAVETEDGRLVPADESITETTPFEHLSPRLRTQVHKLETDVLALEANVLAVNPQYVRPQDPRFNSNNPLRILDGLRALKRDLTQNVSAYQAVRTNTNARPGPAYPPPQAPAFDPGHNQRLLDMYSKLPQEQINAILEGSSRINLPQVVVEELSRMPNSPEVGAYLSLHPQVAWQICATPVASQIAAIGRLSMQLERGPQKFQSGAPSPISPVGGGSHRSSVPLDEMPYAEYRAARDHGRTR